MDIGEMPADSWWKLITPKEINAGINQLNGRKILILDLASFDIIVFKHINNATNIFFPRELIVRLALYNLIW